MKIFNNFLNNLDSIEDVVLAVIKDKDGIFDKAKSDEEFDELNKIYNCQYGSDGFCGKSQEIFKFYKTSEWRNLNLEQVFNKMVDNSWEFFIKTYGIGYIGK